jgi:hypothetical protein
MVIAITKNVEVPLQICLWERVWKNFEELATVSKKINISRP